MSESFSTRLNYSTNKEVYTALNTLVFQMKETLLLTDVVFYPKPGSFCNLQPYYGTCNILLKTYERQVQNTCFSKHCLHIFDRGLALFFMPVVHQSTCLGVIQVIGSTHIDADDLLKSYANAIAAVLVNHTPLTD
ncbi:MAG: hypothetical protein Q8R57_07150 [Bacteroidota bacterium]|nr:hypothetical protein [Bacteroidota bacterium]